LWGSGVKPTEQQTALLRGLKGLRENFSRPSGTRSGYPLFPALEAPGYFQAPLWGGNLGDFVPPVCPQSSSHTRAEARIKDGIVVGGRYDFHVLRFRPELVKDAD
jgi:hypothetical protein